MLFNGSNTITLASPASFTNGNYTLILPSAQSASNSFQWLSNSGTGTLSWTSSAGGLTGNAVIFSPILPQQSALSGMYLFNLQSLKTGTVSTALNSVTPGAIISSATSGVSANATGLTINVSNSSSAATGLTMKGFYFHTTTNDNSSSTSVQVGLSVYVLGSGINYAALFNGGNAGFGTSTPAELLEVNGNIRISGINGIKITEGSNGTMGTATLVAGTVIVNTSSVTANSRIFLMEQNNTGAANGTAFINARVAGTSFTIRSTNGADASDVAWWIIEP